MAITNKADFKKLILLQEKDIRILELNSRIEEIPENLSEMDERLAEEKEKLALVKEKEKEILVRKKEKENDLSSKEAEKSKHQNELNAIKSNDAYKALLKEIDICDVRIGQLEEDILNLFEEIDGLAKEQAEEKAAVSELEKRFSVERGKLEKERAALQEELKAKEEERAGLVSSVEEGLLGQYEAIRARRKGIGISKVVDNVCAACRTRITPQKDLDIHKANVLVNCDYCMRILYLPEKPAEEAEAAPAAEAPPAPKTAPDTSDASSAA